jgi:phage protein D
MIKMMRPTYEVNIGSEMFSTENGNDIISIHVIRSVGLPTDSCEVFLVGSKSYSFERDDEVKVKLGYDEELVPVFNGFVDKIEYGISMVRLTSLGPALGLLRLRIDRIYLNQTAGKIVKDLAQEAGLNIAEASDGINLPTYVVDDTANAYEHILRLAERCNFVVYITEDDKLIFKEWNGSKKHTLEYGKDLIRVEELDFVPLYGSTRIFGESPASVKGAETSHWLTKQEIRSEAGSGDVLSIADAAIRDTETAETVAKAKLDKLKYTFSTVVETVGNPDIKVGNTIALEGMPNSAIDGELEVRGVAHYLSKIKGFTTIIDCWMKR